MMRDESRSLYQTRLTLLAIAVLTAAVPLAVAQYQPPPPPLTSAPCVPTRKDPCTPPQGAPSTPSTAERFPFPGESPGVTDSQPGAPSAAPAPNPTPAAALPPAPPGARDVPDPSRSSSSSSDSDTSSPDALPLPDESPSDTAKPSARPPKTSLGHSGRRHLPKVEDLDRRESTDLEVSHYYLSTGNLQGAYLRAKDAVTIYPSDPEAHLALAQTAERLKKNAEAIAEYKQFLTLDPDNDKAKSAQRALSVIEQR